MTPVKNIIFDLGNVLYDIDFEIMYKRFHELGIPNFENHFTLNQSDPLFFDLEKGFIDEVTFCSRFNQLYNLSLNKDQIIEAWNSLLIGFREKSLDWLKSNQSNFSLFLYSNTNQPHQDYFLAQ